MSQQHLFEEEQFVISPELLHILHWLLKYEEAALLTLVHQAYLKGIEENLQNQDMYNQLQNADDLQNSIVHFLNFLEQEISLISQNNSNKKIIHHNVMQALDHIDPKRCDYETIKSTVIATAHKIKLKDHKDAKTMFLKELLKQWDPKKNKDQKAIFN